jgi:thiamine biosynthesis lipoprotein
MNRSAGSWFAASDVLYACVELALDAARQTGGLFDPTLLYAIEALGYDRDFAEIARHEAPRPASMSDDRALLAAGGWRAIMLDRARRRIQLPKGVGLDLGGIAKGWAADVAFERFCAAFPGALINLGGDLRLHGGPQPGQAWSVGIRDPRGELLPSEPRYAALITCSRGGLATSGAPARWWLQGGRLRHHLLDPRTGRPMRLWTSGAAGRAGGWDAGDEQHGDAKPIATATALAPTATQAEVAAKVALLRGRQAALRAVEHAWGHPYTVERSGPDVPSDPPSSMDADVALLLTYGDGEVVLSRTMRPYLATWGTQGASVPLRIGGNAGRAGFRPLDG